jgi:hypothetical protein
LSASCSGTTGALLLMLSWTSSQNEETARAAWLRHKQPYSKQYPRLFAIDEYAQPAAISASLQVHGKSSVTSSAEFRNLVFIQCFLASVSAYRETVSTGRKRFFAARKTCELVTHCQ